jgi:hypothetical protein
MINQNMFIVFIITIVIFTLCTLYKKNNKNEYFSEEINQENLKKNLELVEKFDRKEIKFNELKKPNDQIQKYQTFYNPDIFPDLKFIDFLIVKNELNEYVKNFNNQWIEWPEYDLWNNNNKDDKHINKNIHTASWNVIPLMAFSKWSNTNTKFFPKTVSELKNIKGLVSAGFSKLGPQTTLKLHKGWGDLSNNVLRCHLGIIVPNFKCKIFVVGSDTDMMYQEEGKWIVFDDSLYHSASNEHKTKDRIILLLDIKRPDNILKGESDVKNSSELNNFINEFNK